MVIALLTVLLALGTQLSSRANMVITSIKIAVVLLVIVVGFFYFKASNLAPLIPPSQPSTGGVTATPDQPLLQVLIGAAPSNLGTFGLLAAASPVFFALFAFIGSDVVATAAEETKNPQQDLPRGIFGSLTIVTVLYVLVSIVVAGMVPYDELGGEKASPATAVSVLGVGWAGRGDRLRRARRTDHRGDHAAQEAAGSGARPSRSAAPVIPIVSVIFCVRPKLNLVTCTWIRFASGC